MPVFVAGCCDKASFRKDYWLRRIAQGNENPKPPTHWLALQKSKRNLDPSGAGRIWFRNYRPEKRAMHWAMADFAEWHAAGMHIKEDE
jgi:hypothetical protein